jgi:hypothetical protein
MHDDISINYANFIGTRDQQLLSQTPLTLMILYEYSNELFRDLKEGRHSFKLLMTTPFYHF